MNDHDITELYWAVAHQCGPATDHVAVIQQFGQEIIKLHESHRRGVEPVIAPLTDEEIMAIWWSNHAALQAQGADHDLIRIRFARQVRGEIPVCKEDLLKALLRQAVTIMEMHRDLHGGKFFPALPGFIDECNRAVDGA